MEKKDAYSVVPILNSIQLLRLAIAKKDTFQIKTKLVLVTLHYVRLVIFLLMGLAIHLQLVDVKAMRYLISKHNFVNVGQALFLI